MRTTHSRLWIASLGLFCLGGLTRPGVVAGQARESFQSAPREVMQMLNQSRKALEDKRFTEAVDYLAGILSADEQAQQDLHELVAEDYFIGSLSQNIVRTSVKSEAWRLLGTSAETREAYELRFGAQARALLDQAIDQSDAQLLTSVVRKFFHTQAGYEATLLFARQQMDLGRPLSAAVQLRSLVESPVAAKFEPDLSLWLATCWLQAGLPNRAKDTLVDFKKRWNQPAFRIGKEETQLFSDDNRAVEWLNQLIGERQAIRPAGTTQWVMFRGNATRNACSVGGLPIVGYRWKVPTANDYDDQQGLERLRAQHVKSGQPVLPSLHPLAVNDYVFMRTPNNLLGIEFATGKRKFDYPWWDEKSKKEEASRIRARSNPQDMRLQDLNLRVWQDIPFGQLASNGELVFLLNDLDTNMNFTRRQQIMIAGFGQGVAPNATNTLAALEIRREGAMRWSVGGEKGFEEPRLAGAFFLGAPLVVNEQLFVLAEMNGEIRLCVLAATTGKLLWSQQVAHVDTRTIVADHNRRLAGATPSGDGGIIVCPTSAGAIVAVDGTKRTILWGFQYQQPVTNQNNGFFVPQMMTPMQPPGNRWADPSVTIADGCVLVTPIESDRAYCLDLLTGDSKWKEAGDKLGVARGEMLYVACVHDQKAIFVGKNTLTAIKLADGSAGWAKPLTLPNNEMPSGRGYYSNGHYYLPTTGAQLLRIDLSKGEIVQRMSTGSVLGNLICYKDCILAQGVDYLYAFYEMEGLRQTIATRLAAEPNDVWALARQGELQLQESKVYDALVSLRKAHKLAGKDHDYGDEIQSLLVSALLAAIRDDFKANRDIVSEVTELVEKPDQHVEFLRLLATRLHELGDLAGAFQNYLKLADLRETRPEDFGSDRPAMERVDRDLLVRRDRWMQVRFQELLAKASADDQVKLQAIITQRWEAARQADNPIALRRFLALFGFHPLADQARLELAAQLLKDEHLLEAQLVLARPAASDNPAFAAPAAALFARLFEKAKRHGQSAHFLRLLKDKWTDTPCLDGKTGLQLYAAAADRPGLQAAIQGHAWPSGKTVVTEFGTNTANYQNIIPITLREVRGPLTPGTIVVWHQSNAIMVRDGLGEEPVKLNLNDGQRVYFNNQLSHGKANGHLIVVSMGNELIAIDSLRPATNAPESILWRHNLNPTPTDPNQGFQQRTRSTTNALGNESSIAIDSSGHELGRFGPLNETGVAFLKQRELTCVEPLTGETIWTRENMPLGADLFGDDELLFVVPTEGGEAQVLSPLDGRLLGKRKVDGQSRLATNGRRVLAYRQEGISYVLRLYDAWAEKELWTLTVAQGSKTTLIDADEFAVLQKDGTFSVVSLTDGKVKLASKVEPEPNLVGIHVLRGGNQLFLATNQPSGPSRNNIQPAPGRVYSPLIDGRLYAFDRTTGQAQWPVPATIAKYSLPLDQPADAPVLTLLRNAIVPGNNNKESSSVLCLDKRDGRIVLAKDDLPQRLHSYRVLANPEQSTVNVMLSNKSFSIKFTDDPTPPEPPAQTSDTAAVFNAGQLVPAVRNLFRGRALRGVIGE